MNKHFTRLFAASSALTLALAACGPQTTLVQPETNNNSMSVRAQELVQQYEQQGQTYVQVLDVGKGKKTSAAIAISFNYQSTSGFNTKQSKPGHEGQVETDITDYHVYLLECDSGLMPPAPGTNIAPLDLVATTCTYKWDDTLARTGTGGQSFIFDNVPASSGPSDRYYVAVEALNTGININTFTGYDVSTPVSARHVALSTLGGNASTGGTHVNADYSIPAGDEPTLGIILQLISDKGAEIDSHVNVNDGTTTYQGTIGVQ